MAEPPPAADAGSAADSRPQGPPVKARVIIIGGGIGGLACARALLDAGADVHIYEKRDLQAMLSGPSGLGLGANALQALQLLSGSRPGASLAEDVAAAGVGDVGWFVVTTHNGAVLKRVPQGTFRSPDGSHPLGTFGVNIARPALQRALYAALPPGIVTCGTGFQSFRQRDDGKVEVCLMAADGGGKEHVEVCDVLVGADGIWSAVRACLDEQGGGPPRQPRYSGYNWYRGLVDLQQEWPGGPADWDGKWGGVSMTMFYGAQGAGVAYKVGQHCMCFGRYAASSPGAIQREREQAPEQAKRHLQELCSGYCLPMRDLANATDPGKIAMGELWHMPPAPEVWGSGCVTLLGDAIHAMLPVLGQGASQAIESAVALAATLHQASAASGGAPLSPAELAAALRRYEAGRAPRAARVRNAAEELFYSAVGESRWARLKRDWFFWLLPVSLMRKAGAWVFQAGLSWQWGPGAPPTAAAQA